MNQETHSRHPRDGKEEIRGLKREKIKLGLVSEIQTLTDQRWGISQEATGKCLRTEGPGSADCKPLEDKRSEREG